MNMEICFEDDHLLVVNKPTGVLSQPGKTVDGSVATQMREAYPNATGPMLVHRLDMDTSGLLVLAKSRENHRHLQQQFEKRVVSKRYVAILSRSPQGMGGSVQLPLRLDVNNRPVQIVCFEYGKKAQTIWHSVLTDSGNLASRVIFTPISGRTHQLRVHAAHPDGLNAAIVGDRLYGLESTRLMLHADQIQFTHPVNGNRMVVDCPAPF